MAAMPVCVGRNPARSSYALIVRNGRHRALEDDSKTVSCLHLRSCVVTRS